MNIRRYYRKGVKYPYTFMPNINDYQQFIFTCHDKGYDDRKIDEIDNAEIEFILTVEEQLSWYRDCMYRIMTDTRYVLDTIEFAPEFKVGWENYHKKKNRKVYKGKDYGSSNIEVP